MTTIQTQAHRGTYTPTGSRVRGVKGFVIGFVALAAAATAIGIATSGTTEAPATVIAPVSHTAPNTEAREAMNRLQGTSEAVWSYPGKPGIR